jgi:hypothetical protein
MQENERAQSGVLSEAIVAAAATNKERIGSDRTGDVSNEGQDLVNIIQWTRVSAKRNR